MNARNMYRLVRSGDGQAMVVGHFDDEIKALAAYEETVSMRRLRQGYVLIDPDGTPIRTTAEDRRLKAAVRKTKTRD